MLAKSISTSEPCAIKKPVTALNRGFEEERGSAPAMRVAPVVVPMGAAR